jgi:hypothetical protein
VGRKFRCSIESHWWTIENAIMVCSLYINSLNSKGYGTRNLSVDKPCCSRILCFWAWCSFCARESMFIKPIEVYIFYSSFHFSQITTAELWVHKGWRGDTSKMRDMENKKHVCLQRDCPTGNRIYICTKERLFGEMSFRLHD